MGFLHGGDAPLHAYVRRKDKNKLDCLMAFLTDPKCDVDVVNEEGDSPLHLACKVWTYITLSPGNPTLQSLGLGLGLGHARYVPSLIPTLSAPGRAWG